MGQKVGPRTTDADIEVSALGQKQTYASRKQMSAKCQKRTSGAPHTQRFGLA